MSKGSKKRILISSAKQKGRLLQQYVRDKLLELCPSLSPDDVRSTGMGQAGCDIMLSAAGKKRIPLAVECKSTARNSIYRAYRQACVNAQKDKDNTLMPLVVVKADRETPLAVMEASLALYLLTTYWSEDEDRSNPRHSSKTGDQPTLPDLDREVSGSKKT